MNNLPQVFSKLRHYNVKQYLLLAGCCFLSSLLITAYSCIMRAPTVLRMLPQGGDSRKQVMMIFVLAVLGCCIFTIYAFSIFFRQKSYDIGIFLALGATQGQIRHQLMKELLWLTSASCFIGALLGIPLTWGIWQIFRLALVDTQEMLLVFQIQSCFFPILFALFILAALLTMLHHFIQRQNIMEVVYQSRKSEPIHEVPHYYGVLGITLTIGGLVLGYLLPVFCMNVLQWYLPEGLTLIGYIPAILGVYMLLLHTAINGRRNRKSRYKSIISDSMMKFQGRQTVRNMLVITVLVAGAYFAAFYVPNMAANAAEDFHTRKFDYAFRYRGDQNMLTETQIREMALEEDVVIQSYAMRPMAMLGVDGWDYVEDISDLGVSTYTTKYLELCRGELFLSESAYNELMGSAVDVEQGMIMAVYDEEGRNRGRTTKDISIVTNPITKSVLHVTPYDEVLENSMLFGCKVLDDSDYLQITKGLTDEWQEFQVFFNVENYENTYLFANRLFYGIVDCSQEEVAIHEGYDPIVKMRFDEKGNHYFLDRAYQEEYGYELIDYAQYESSAFRMNWSYMPTFRVLDKVDFVKTYGVFLVLFIFIALICFAAVIVIVYTRSLTIAMTNENIYRDLHRLGASNAFLYKTVKEQISKVFYIPILTGSVTIYIFYVIILFFNDGSLTANELLGLGISMGIIVVMSIVLYGIYRITLYKVCAYLKIDFSFNSR